METFYAKNRAEWRAWLRKNGRTAGEVWLLYYKKGSGKPRVAYDEAVEEALCFGWIDGKIKRIDEACYAQRFTPRKPKSPWSQSNIDRVQELIAAGKMTPDGLKAFSPERRQPAPAMPTALPKELERQFRAQTEAWENFQRFPPYYRRMTARWVASAKRDETRLERLRKLIEFSDRNERIKFM